MKKLPKDRKPNNKMITGPQLRAARRYLDWSRTELAEESGISQETIQNIEREHFKPHPSTLNDLIKCFLEHGLEFTEGGVRKVPVCPKCGWSERQTGKQAE